MDNTAYHAAVEIRKKIQEYERLRDNIATDDMGTGKLPASMVERQHGERHAYYNAEIAQLDRDFKRL